jgi:hypothetical protein
MAIYPNKQAVKDGEYGFNYLIEVGVEGPRFLVNANDPHQAADIVADYCAEHMPEKLLTRDEEAQARKAGMIDHYMQAGEGEWYFASMNIAYLDITPAVSMTKGGQRHKYECAVCGMKVWGKAGLKVMCAGDGQVLIENE